MTDTEPTPTPPPLRDVLTRLRGTGSTHTADHIAAIRTQIHATPRPHINDATQATGHGQATTNAGQSDAHARQRNEHAQRDTHASRHKLQPRKGGPVLLWSVRPPAAGVQRTPHPPRDVRIPADWGDDMTAKRSASPGGLVLPPGAVVVAVEGPLVVIRLDGATLGDSRPVRRSHAERKADRQVSDEANARRVGDLVAASGRAGVRPSRVGPELGLSNAPAARAVALAESMGLVERSDRVYVTPDVAAALRAWPY